MSRTLRKRKYNVKSVSKPLIETKPSDLNQPKRGRGRPKGSKDSYKRVTSRSGSRSEASSVSALSVQSEPR